MVGTTITAENDTGFKRNSTELCQKNDISGPKFVTFR